MPKLYSSNGSFGKSCRLQVNRDKQYLHISAKVNFTVDIRQSQLAIQNFAKVQAEEQKDTEYNLSHVRTTACPRDSYMSSSITSLHIDHPKMDPAVFSFKAGHKTNGKTFSVKVLHSLVFNPAMPQIVHWR